MIKALLGLAASAGVIGTAFFLLPGDIPKRLALRPEAPQGRLAAAAISAFVLAALMGALGFADVPVFVPLGGLLAAIWFGAYLSGARSRLTWRQFWDPSAAAPWLIIVFWGVVAAAWSSGTSELLEAGARQAVLGPLLTTQAGVPGSLALVSSMIANVGLLGTAAAVPGAIGRLIRSTFAGVVPALIAGLLIGPPVSALVLGPISLWQRAAGSLIAAMALTAVAAFMSRFGSRVQTRPVLIAAGSLAIAALMLSVAG